MGFDFADFILQIHPQSEAGSRRRSGAFADNELDARAAQLLCQRLRCFRGVNQAEAYQAFMPTAFSLQPSAFSLHAFTASRLQA
ncbi:hypothetical protein E4U17_006846 [Claviceps sp. LM77 group G4]|nr:hypothetical protein E4U17_006846 [Claviceps sp. LM77 group G4]KAG6060431.1 hypothetical protein E4U33_006939 [Claviceps sp. LM78 group G4]